MMGSELESFPLFDFLKSNKAWSIHGNDSPDFGKHQLQAIRRRRSSGLLTKINYCVCPHGGLYIPALLELHKQVRERRRSRSNSTTGRSRTPSSVSSGRTTPSPGPSLLSPLNGRTMSDDSLSQTRLSSPPRFVSREPRKYTTVCWLEPRSVPVHYSSTVLITLGSTRKRYTEDVRFQTRLTTRRVSETVETPVSRHYVSTIEIPRKPYNHMFDGELSQVPSDSEA